MEGLTLLLGVVNVAIAVALPFVLYILNGIRSNIHELRVDVQRVALKVAAHEAVLRNGAQRARLGDDDFRMAEAGVR